MEKPSGSLQQSFSLFINYHHKKCKGRCLVTVDHSERREGAGGPSLDAASSRNGLSDSRREAQRTTSERLRAGGCLLPCIRGTADSRRVFWRAPRTVQGEAVRCRRQVGSHPLTILRVRGHVVGSGGRHCLPSYKTRESRDIQTEMLRPTRKIGPRRDNIVIVRSRSHHPELAFCTIAGQASPYFPRGIGVLTWLTPRKKREHPA